MNRLLKCLDWILRISPGLPAANVEASPAHDPEEKHWHRLPGSRQWSPGVPRPVNKAAWQSCAGCGRSIPVMKDWLVGADGQPQRTGTWSAVCPFCAQCQVGTPGDDPSDQRQKTCHECGTNLGDKFQCPQCSFPRGWMRVKCPSCQKPHPVLAPHWVDGCDTFRLECAHCETVFVSLCIC